MKETLSLYWQHKDIWGKLCTKCLSSRNNGNGVPGTAHGWVQMTNSSLSSPTSFSTLVPQDSHPGYWNNMMFLWSHAAHCHFPAQSSINIRDLEARLSLWEVEVRRAWVLILAPLFAGCVILSRSSISRSFNFSTSKEVVFIQQTLTKHLWHVWHCVKSGP
jgi:hypothetical protein